MNISGLSLLNFPYNKTCIFQEENAPYIHLETETEKLGPYWPTIKNIPTLVLQIFFFFFYFRSISIMVSSHFAPSQVAPSHFAPSYSHFVSLPFRPFLISPLTNLPHFHFAPFLCRPFLKLPPSHLAHS